MTVIQQLKEQGIDALATENYQLAVDCLNQVYDYDRTFENNQLFARALSKNGQNDSALTIAQEYVGEYLGQQKDYQFYFELCLKAKHFIMARRMAVESIEESDKVRRIEEVAAAEENERAENPKVIDQAVRRFRHIAAFDVLTQQQIYQDALNLPVRDFVDAARNVLLDPDCFALIRISILTDIQCLFLHQKFSYRFIDGEVYTTILCDHPKPLRDPAFSKAREYLSRTVGQEDPVAYGMLLDQLRLEMNTVFPQLDRITDPIAWVQADVAMFNDKEGRVDFAESADQKNLHEMVHHFLEEMGAS
ncbi:hypothetical protein LQZ24_02200 [Fructobacillus sp. M1-13]|uniref:TPR repeat-containing protein n=1 Tax=Fructobacillus papyriferae TaxID=2713171 RepID=A0ABS5QQS4_9LACO|nr:hypothetical protein [Fructobacillus papyriferae]MBS9334850.1 hypothetical protein [Fructobacillus papyriferae]MCD2158840.1 hypothetical protein [Fructobacillus papyriferae]